MDNVNVPYATLNISARTIETTASVVERNLNDIARIRACMEILRGVAKDLQEMANNTHAIQQRKEN